MSSQKTTPDKLLESVHGLVPHVIFMADTTFYWSPRHQTIAYTESRLGSDEGAWSLLHEVAHALLDHHTYETDFELLMLEVAAWNHAKNVAKGLDIAIDEDYLQDCLDTYRDWLHRRSTCPTCGNVGLQHSPSEYRCHNCHNIWHVTTARFCRPYRKKQLSSKEKSPDSVKNQTTFR